MRCPECGADLPGEETCLERFHRLLIADMQGGEAGEVHGLTVLTFHVQHVQSTGVKPWWQAAAYEMLWQIFGRGRDWREVLADNRRHPAAAEWKTRYAATPGPLIPVTPVRGEQTIADIDPTAPPGHLDRVVAWARSVAAARGLTTAPPAFDA